MNVPWLILFALTFQMVSEPSSIEVPPTRQQGIWIADTAFVPTDIIDASPTRDIVSGEWTVVIRFSETGRAKFEQLQRGRLNQVLEIVVDGVTVSTPLLREIISGDRVQIASGMTENEAALLARRFSSPQF